METFEARGRPSTTGTDIKPQKAQSFLGLFFCGVDTGVEQGGAAKPRIIPVRSYNCARGSYRRCRAVMRDSVILSLALMLVEVF